MIKHLMMHEMYIITIIFYTLFFKIKAPSPALLHAAQSLFKKIYTSFYIYCIILL